MWRPNYSVINGPFHRWLEAMGWRNFQFQNEEICCLQIALLSRQIIICMVVNNPQFLKLKYVMFKLCMLMLRFHKNLQRHLQRKSQIHLLILKSHTYDLRKKSVSKITAHVPVFAVITPSGDYQSFIGVSVKVYGLFNSSSLILHAD